MRCLLAGTRFTEHWGLSCVLLGKWLKKKSADWPRRLLFICPFTPLLFLFLFSFSLYSSSFFLLLISCLELWCDCQSHRNHFETMRQTWSQKPCSKVCRASATIVLHVNLQISHERLNPYLINVTIIGHLYFAAFLVLRSIYSSWTI